MFVGENTILPIPISELALTKLTLPCNHLTCDRWNLHGIYIYILHSKDYQKHLHGIFCEVSAIFLQISRRLTQLCQVMNKHHPHTTCEGRCLRLQDKYVWYSVLNSPPGKTEAALEESLFKGQISDIYHPELSRTNPFLWSSACLLAYICSCHSSSSLTVADDKGKSAGTHLVNPSLICAHVYECAGHECGPKWPPLRLEYMTMGTESSSVKHK